MPGRRTDQPDITLGKVTIATPASARKDVVMTPNKKLKIADVEYADNVDAYYRLTISLENIVPASGKTITEDDKNKVGSMFYTQNEYGVFTLGNNTKISNKQILIPSTLDNNIQGATATILVKAEAIKKEGITVDPSDLRDQYADYDSRPIYYQSLEAFKTTGHEVEDPYFKPEPTLDKLTFTGLDASGATTTTEGDIVAYRVSAVSTAVTKGEVVIPAEYNGKPVTVLLTRAFQQCSELTSITIPGSVTNFGEFAFYDCRGLTSVTLSSGVTSIGNYAFTGCGKLTNIEIPDSVTNIGKGTFGECYSLTHISIPSSVTSIEDHAFGDCALSSITIPSSVTTIGVKAFRNCKLTNIEIPSSVTSIGESAFLGCVRLTSATIANGVTSIGNNAFENCRGLTSITIPGSLTNISSSIFKNCTGLTSANISDGVTSIGDYAFNGCKLTSIIIPSSVSSIGSSVFTGCDLTNIVVEEGNKVYDSRDNCNCIIETATNILLYGCKNSIIPSSVTTIGNDAFYKCTGLTNVTIPNGVISIGNYAFNGCTGLTNVTISSSVKSIGMYSFAHCNQLIEVNLQGDLNRGYTLPDTSGYHWEYSVDADGTDSTTVTSMQAAGYYHRVPNA